MKVKCPRCEQMQEWVGNPYRPFCSERCKLLDLGKWASEEYRVPMHEVEDVGSVPEETPEGEKDES